MYEEPGYDKQSMGSSIAMVVGLAAVILIVLIGGIVLLTGGDNTDDQQSATTTTSQDDTTDRSGDAEPGISPSDNDQQPTTPETPDILVTDFDHDSYSGKYLDIELWEIEIPLGETGFISFFRSSASRLELSSKPLTDIVGEDCDVEDVYVDRGEADDVYREGFTYQQVFEAGKLGDSLALVQAGQYYYIYTPGTETCDAGDTSTARQELINLATGIRPITVDQADDEATE